MLVIYPFCEKDWVQTCKNIEWAKELERHLPFTAILSHDDRTHPSHVAEVQRAAERLFEKVIVFWYPAPLKTSWPAAPNWAWQNIARYIACIHPKESWLWLEPDSVPIRKRWLHDIEAEHLRGGKPFTGVVPDGMAHMTGVAVYPPDVAAYSQAAMRTEEAAWDVVLGKDIQGMIHGKHTLFQHAWCINAETGKPWNGSGEVPTFKSTHDVVRLVDMKAALFHRNKDGTLIEWLRRFYAHPEEAYVPVHVGDAKSQVEQPRAGSHVEMREASTRGQPPPQRSDSPAANGAGQPTPDRPFGFTGKAEIMVVTYHKDAPWLQYAMACMRKHATGFSGLTLCLPKKDREAFGWLAKADVGMPINVQLYDEAPAKGMIQHMAILASADQMVPSGTTHVLSMDADCMIKEPISPDEYFIGTKPIYVIRSYAGLHDPVRKVTSDCAQWKEPTERQLGFETPFFTMCRHPTGLPIDFYPLYRNHIERVHKRDFFAYMLSGKNSFPQNRMDWTAFGAFAYEKMRDRFEWIDVDKVTAPSDKVKAYWSHGGITPEIRAEIEGFLGIQELATA